MMTYAAAATWLDEFANVEQKLDPTAWSGVKLERVERLMELLGHPERGGRTIHIAGSKGKGSVAAMVDSVLRAAGLSCGLYTSPHLVSARERIRLDGAPIPRAMVADLVSRRLRPAAEAYRRDPVHGPLTFFDLHTALAFCWLEEAQAAWRVLEVGLGGRLDATNVCQPEVCAIVAICLEHTALLGATIDSIAGEKAGIIKFGVPVVTAPQQPAAAAVLAATSAARGASLHPATGVEAVPGGAFVEAGDGRLGQWVDVRWPTGGGQVLLPLLGAHQVENAAVARTVLELAAAQVPGGLPWTAVQRGLETVRWPGRLEVVSRRPWVVLDGAHTPRAAEVLVDALQQFPHRRRFFVLGSALDKDFGGLAERLLPGSAGVVVTSLPGNPRAAAADRLLPAVEPFAAQCVAIAEPAAALAQARAWAEPDDLVCVTGSLYLVGAVLEHLRGPEPAA